MRRFLFFLLFHLIFAGSIVAQPSIDSTGIPVRDSVLKKDTTIINIDSLHIIPVSIPVSDSVSKRPALDSGWVMIPGVSFSSAMFSWQIMQHHPYFGFNAVPERKIKVEIKEFKGKELLFYLLVLLLIIYALLRMMFPKYFSNLFRLLFRTTLKQRQIKEQLMQTPLPSLLLNGFFVVCSGLYITFLLQYFKLSQIENFWLLFLYCCIGLSASYFLKFAGLKLAGWLFDMEETANSYIFIVFVINKMIGILLLPFLVLQAFSTGNIYTGAITISWCLIAGMLIYRFILTYATIHNEVKVNPFHFFLYVCAFEIAPLLLIYKGLLLFFRQTT